MNTRRVPDLRKPFMENAPKDLTLVSDTPEDLRSSGAM
jgi:hypothetical protein